MHILKVILGIALIVAAILVGPFAWLCFRWGELWFKSLPILFIMALAALGLFLILKRRQRMSKRTQILVALFVFFLIASPLLLVAKIRHDRWSLQARAKAFLSRPVPTVLKPNADGYVGDYYVDAKAGPQNGVFGYSLILIERYATKGRIRWSSKIQGQFAGISKGVNPNINSDVIDSNEEVRLYLAERNAILAREWRMGFSQFIEDSIEMKREIPELEEEYRDDRYVRLLNGTWTNHRSDAITILHNGTFSARLSSQTRTNNYRGNWSCRVSDRTLKLFPKSVEGPAPSWSVDEWKELRIVNVDEHNLVYELDGRTNSMKH